MVIYADTSFLFSLYANDANSVQSRTLGRALRAPITFTEMQQHELRNALRLSVFRKEITPDQCRSVLALIEADVQRGVLSETQVPWTEAYAIAEMLSKSHTLKLGCRASDILHVAIAEALKIRRFYTFDIRQKKLARDVGLNVFPA